MFSGLINFSTEKLAKQVQQLFLKLIEIAITEASFLLPAQKKLFNAKDNKEGEALINTMLSNHLKREMTHVLFSQGANTSIDQIKKASFPIYLKSEQLTQAIIQVSTSHTDQSGKKQFRLNQKGKHEAVFDPYYIVRKREESA